jgi:hypothetical protein
VRVANAAATRTAKIVLFEECMFAEKISKFGFEDVVCWVN